MIIDLESGEINMDEIFVMKRMRKLNTALMCLCKTQLWKEFSSTNKKLQSPQLDLGNL